MKLIPTEDGSLTLLSPSLGVTYHSIHGAIQETETVFIQAALCHLGQHRPPLLHILDIGFGTGLNALMTYKTAHQQGYKVRYQAMEAYPIDLQTVSQLNYAQCLGDPALHHVLWQMHEHADTWVELSPDFVFQKQIALFQSLHTQQTFDIIYYDAFAPAAQPELWDVDQFVRMYNALRSGGILTTYCAKGSVKRALKTAGFAVESLPGPKGKREMTRALKL